MQITFIHMAVDTMCSVFDLIRFTPLYVSNYLRTMDTLYIFFT